MTDAPQTALLQAVLALQADAPTLPKDATNPHYRSKYTPLDTVVETVRPLLKKHGLVWMTLPVSSEGRPALFYRLAHADSGEAIDGIMPLLLGKEDSQGLGSAITYARRYSLCAVLNLVGDEDDDGNAASPAGASSAPSGRVSSTDPATQAQLTKLKGLITQNKPPEKTLRIMLYDVGADGVDPTKPQWSKALKKNQASALIDRFMSGALPTGDSDIPFDEVEAS